MPYDITGPDGKTITSQQDLDTALTALKTLCMDAAVGILSGKAGAKSFTLLANLNKYRPPCMKIKVTVLPDLDEGQAEQQADPYGQLPT